VVIGADRLSFVLLSNDRRVAMTPTRGGRARFTTNLPGQALQLRLIKIGARAVRHARAITFQPAEVAVSGPPVRTTAGPGRDHTARIAYLREIMEALSPVNPVQRAVFMKAARVGATEAGNCFIGFVMHQAPGPMPAAQPTVELAGRNSCQRICPLIEESPELRERVSG